MNQRHLRQIESFGDYVYVPWKEGRAYAPYYDVLLQVGDNRSKGTIHGGSACESGPWKIIIPAYMKSLYSSGYTTFETHHSPCAGAQSHWKHRQWN